MECVVCGANNTEDARFCLRCATPIPVAGGPEAKGSDEDATVLIDTPKSWTLPIRESPSQDAPAELCPGVVLGERYQIIRMLGEGGMGAVYQARDTELDRMVALKVVRPKLSQNPDMLRRFKQELILTRQVTHKNVIRIFDLVAADGWKFITMEFVEGRDLRSILAARGKLPPQEAAAVIEQVAQGLDAAHSAGVIHRDLKPPNIMVDKQGRVLVMDFGLARSLETAGLTRTGTLMGTPSYMSPEQARGEKADARSDLFTVGIIFYEMLTGRLPFEAETPMASLFKRARERAIPPRDLDPEIPATINDVVMKCLETSPERRYQSAAELLRDLGHPGEKPQPSMVAAALNLDLGADIGPRYRIEALIGEGGMGKVYRAYDKELDRTVALKLVRPEFARDPSSMQRFRQELLLASRISHRNILRIHDLAEAGGVKFISMAYIEGRDLHDLMVECGRLPVDRAVAIGVQLCHALEAAHAEGVVHRDLKPRNVLVGKDDHVYVSDFGLAKSLASQGSSMTSVGEVLGTPRYMSPEQAESKPVDHRTDIYSLGLILYEMVTEAVPFADESALQTMFQRVTQKPRSPKLANADLPDYLEAVIMRCLEKDPADRYQSAREVLQDLEARKPPKPRPQAVTGQTVRSPRSYLRWLAPAGIVLLIAAASALPPVRDRVVRLWHYVVPAAPAHQTYIALLPFRVVGDDAALKDVADGVVDAVSAKLYQLKNVYVASATAAEGALKEGTPEKIAKNLGVTQLVQGTVQGGGSNISLVVSLEDIARKRTVWKQEFSGSTGDLLTIENQIYSKLASSLALKVTNEEMARGATRLTSDIAAYQLYLRARSLLHAQQNLQNVTAALDLYNQAILKDPGFALAYAGVADAAQRMYNLKNDPVWTERALGAAQQARALNDNLPEVHFALGNVYSRTGKTAEAIAELKRALELAPNSDEGYRRLGFAYREAGNKDEALQAYRKAVDINPYYWLNYSHLGNAYFKFGQNEEALKAFQRAMELSPDSDVVYSNIGGAYLRMGRWNDAIPVLQKTIDRQPSASAYSNLGMAYFYLGNYSEAAKRFEKAVEMNPNQLRVGNLADAYRWMGQRDKANVTYDRAIALALKAYEVNPRDVRTLQYLSSYYAKKGDAKRAEDFIRRARAIDPNDNELMYYEGLVHALAGEKKEAVRSLRLAFEHGYSAEEARNDPELKGLQADPEFDQLLKEFPRNAK